MTASPLPAEAHKDIQPEQKGLEAYEYAAVREALGDPGSRLPVVLAVRAAAEVMWLLDAAAARER